MRFFPGATSLLKGATFIDFWFLKNFLRIFNFLFVWLCIKESNYLLFKRGLCLFKGLCLLFLPNVPGAMFIQGGTFIPDSRVNMLLRKGRICNTTKMISKNCYLLIDKHQIFHIPQAIYKNHTLQFSVLWCVKFFIVSLKSILKPFFSIMKNLKWQKYFWQKVVNKTKKNAIKYQFYLWLYHVLIQLKKVISFNFQTLPSYWNTYFYID